MPHTKKPRILAACLCLALLLMLCACAIVQSPQIISCYAAEPQLEETQPEIAPAADASDKAPEKAPTASPAGQLRPDTQSAGQALPESEAIYHGPERGETALAGDTALAEVCLLPAACSTALSLEAAQADPQFGACFPSAAPEGFHEEEICRSDDSLSGLWTSGYCELRWMVRAFEDADTPRVTAMSETENYDLSLYPIPRADSVPEALREIVDDPIFEAADLTQSVVDARTDTGDEGYDCLNFSVKYGELLVTVRAKGVAPAWVYAQLCALAQP